MKVLHLVKTTAGATWALRQIRELVQQGVEVHVTLPDSAGLASQYAAYGATVHILDTDLPVHRPWRWQRTASSIRRLVSHVRPDIIHSHFVGTTLSARLALGMNHSVPRVFHVPGPLHLEHAAFRELDVGTAGPRDHWIGSCKWTCERYLASGVDPRRVHLAYYGTDTDQFVPRAEGALRTELGIAASTRVVGMVAYMYAPKRYLGQVRGLKGHEDLIDAVAACLQRGYDIVCVMVGGPWAHAEAYAKRVRAYGRKRCGSRVVFLGSRNDVPSLYPDFDVAVHPSHSENVGGAGESLLLAVPTIASAVGGLPDLVIPGVTGSLVPRKDPDALASAICAMLDDPKGARRMASQGRELALRMLNVQKSVLDVLACYRRVLAAD